MHGSGELRRKKALIFEPSAVGHHGPYLEWMVSGLVDRGMAVTIVTLPDAMDHPSLQPLLEMAGREASSGKLRVISSPSLAFSVGINKGTVRVASREFAYWRLFKEWYRLYAKRERPDIVFLPYLDYCLYAIGLLGSPFGNCAWSGIAMRPAFYYQEVGIAAPRPALSTVKKALFFRMLKIRSLHRLLSVSEPLAEYAKDKGATNVDFFPEPASFVAAPKTSEARSLLGIGCERKTILVYGAITRRKGVSELLRAVVDPTFPAEVDVILAGSVSSDVRSELDSPPIRALTEMGRLRILDRFVKVDEEALLFAAVDIIWVGYREHYNSSGIQILAAVARKPIVACAEGVIGWQTRRYKLGEVVDPNDTAAVLAAIKRLSAGNNEVASSTERTVDRWTPPSIRDAQDLLWQVLDEDP